SMFIPDNDFMASLVSDLSEFLSLKLESIDTFMENPQELETLFTRVVVLDSSAKITSY
ncbi:hypothetical protein, partial [Staphylococcus sp. EG-SA-15]|uniref:hypothetical protein n=1 Tax=Staphylococcus sp. EG-SA-15 TaxID=2767492 RepID=UPI001F11AE7A